MCFRRNSRVTFGVGQNKRSSNVFRITVNGDLSVNQSDHSRVGGQRDLADAVTRAHAGLDIIIVGSGYRCAIGPKYLDGAAARLGAYVDNITQQKQSVRIGGLNADNR